MQCGEMLVVALLVHVASVNSCADQPERSANALITVLKDAHPALRRCYEAAAPVGTVGRVALHFSVSPNGTVSDVVTALNTLPEPAAKCMEGVVQQLRFVAVSGCRELVRVRQTYQFTAPEPAKTTSIVIKPGKIIYEGALTKEEIQRAVNPVMGGIKDCNDGEVEGLLSMFWTINRDGAVINLQVDTNTLPSPHGAKTSICVGRIMAGLKFPPPRGGVVNITYPFNYAKAPPHDAGLSKEDIQRVINKVMNQIKYCYDKQLTVDPNVEGKVAVFFTIGANGAVVAVEVTENTFAPPYDAKMADCVGRIIGKLTFPSPKGGGVVNVIYPFNFAGSGGGGQSSTLAAVDLPAVKLLPQPKAEPAPKSCLSGISRATITPVVSADLSSLRSCYHAALQRTPNVSGFVKATFAIGTDGSIRDVVVSPTDLGVEAKPLADCVSTMMRGLRWPSSPHRVYVTVSQSFSFEPTNNKGVGFAAEHVAVLGSGAMNNIVRSCANSDGQLSMQLVINKDGTVGNTQVIDNWFDPRCAQRIATCLQVAVKPLRFPASETTITYPFAVQDDQVLPIHKHPVITIAGP
jgi:hypothetical protein